MLRKVLVFDFPSKNQNPREGIETLSHGKTAGTATLCLQKTKIPVRGLKRVIDTDLHHPHGLRTSKNQNPREGIETLETIGEVSCRDAPSSSKNQNPREGIETSTPTAVLDAYRRRSFKKPKSP